MGWGYAVRDKSAVLREALCHHEPRQGKAIHHERGVRIARQRRTRRSLKSTRGVYKGKTERGGACGDNQKEHEGRSEDTSNRS